MLGTFDGDLQPKVATKLQEAGSCGLRTREEGRGVGARQLPKASTSIGLSNIVIILLSSYRIYRRGSVSVCFCMTVGHGLTSESHRLFVA